MMTMAERPPFDPIKAAFYLVALVISTHCLIVLMGAGLCVWQGVLAGNVECDAKGRLGDLLAGALAAAIAFSGGYIRKPPPDPPKEP